MSKLIGITSIECDGIQLESGKRKKGMQGLNEPAVVLGYENGSTSVICRYVKETEKYGTVCSFDSQFGTDCLYCQEGNENE
jgi:hypothetical protein